MNAHGLMGSMSDQSIIWQNNTQPLFIGCIGCIGCMHVHLFQATSIRIGGERWSTPHSVRLRCDYKSIVRMCTIKYVTLRFCVWSYVTIISTWREDTQFWSVPRLSLQLRCTIRYATNGHCCPIWTGYDTNVWQWRGKGSSTWLVGSHNEELGTVSCLTSIVALLTCTTYRRISGT